MTVTLPYPPSANLYWKHWRGRVVLSREGRDYKVVAKSLARSQQMRPTDGPVSVVLVAYRPRRRGDIDNMIPLALDALRGVAYADDDQIVELHAFRRDDKTRPRLEVQVESAGLIDTPG